MGASDGVSELSWLELRVLARKVLADLPSGDTVNATATNGSEAVVVHGA